MRFRPDKAEANVGGAFELDGPSVELLCWFHVDLK
jgi:hypothetical protein